MSDASPATRRNTAARLGITFTGLGVLVSLVVVLAAALVAMAGAPDVLGPIANANPIVTGGAIACLCSAGIVFGILGMVRARRLREGAISLIAIVLGAIFLILSVLVGGFISLVSTASPNGVS